MTIRQRQEYRQTYVAAPSLPANFVDRPEALEALRNALINDGESRHIALTALNGMGGIGKTMLGRLLNSSAKELNLLRNPIRRFSPVMKWVLRHCYDREALLPLGQGSTGHLRSKSSWAVQHPLERFRHPAETKMCCSGERRRYREKCSTVRT
jgi:hypothetical protein